MPRPRSLGDGGAAVVDFVLVSVLLLGLFLMVLQVGLALHVRNVLVSAAADGARHAANADRGPADGAARTRAAVAEALAGLAGDTTVTAAMVSGPAGLPVVEVQVSAPLPLVLPIRPVRLSVTGHALEEGAP